MTYNFCSCDVGQCSTTPQSPPTTIPTAIPTPFAFVRKEQCTRYVRHETVYVPLKLTANLKWTHRIWYAHYALADMVQSTCSHVKQARRC